MTPQQLADVCVMLVADGITDIERITVAPGQAPRFTISPDEWRAVIDTLHYEHDDLPSSYASLGMDELWVLSDIGELTGIKGLLLCTQIPLARVTEFEQLLLNMGAEQRKVAAAIAMGAAR